MANCKKKGRNSVSAKVYAAEGRRERNKFKKLLRHLKKFPNDAQINESLVVLWGKMGRPQDLSKFVG